MRYMCSIDEKNTVKTTMKSAVAVTFAMVLSLALGIGTLAQAAGEKKLKESKELTILEELNRTDGAQALIAAVTIVDNHRRCIGRFAELLNDKKARVVLLAPTNEGFEVYLNLTPGTLQAWDVDTIARMLPGFLANVGLGLDDLCDVLLRHVSVGENHEDVPSARDLLSSGRIRVLLDESDYPVAIGGGRRSGICVNYESCITERDVQTRNGVIQYLSKVLVRAPVEEPPPPPLPGDSQPPPSDAIDAWCSRSACAEDDDLEAECVDFMNVCLERADKQGDIEGCWAVGLFQCSEREGLFGGDGLFD